VTIEDGLIRVAQGVFDRLTTKELCVDDVCVTRDEFKELLDANGIDSTRAEPTPDVTPLPSGGGGIDSTDDDVEEPVADEELEGAVDSGEGTDGTGEETEVTDAAPEEDAETGTEEESHPETSDSLNEPDSSENTEPIE